MPVAEDRDPLIQTLKRTAYHLKKIGAPFALAGSFAVYARGGGPVDHDVDFLIKEEDAGRILSGLAEAGYRTQVPHEGWLVKVYEEDRLVDLIFSPVQRPVTDETLADTDFLPVNACHMPVLAATELMIHKLLSMGVQSCDFARALPVARSLREQIDWARVERETAHSPYAQAFMVLLDRLNVVSLADVGAGGWRRDAEGGLGMKVDQCTESQLHRLLAEDERVAELGIRVAHLDEGGFALSGEVESDQRRALIQQVVAEEFPDATVRYDIGVTRVHEPEEVEEL